MKKYPKYKPSGVEWIGEIPEEWGLKRLKNFLECEQNGVWGEEGKRDENDKICVRVADFDREFDNLNKTENTIRNIKPQDFYKRELIYGDLLIEKSGGGELTPVGRVGYFDWDNVEAVCANFMARLRLKEQNDSRYFFFLFKALYKNGLNLKSIKQTTGIQNLDTYNYFSEYITAPKSLPEQTAIANYLDDKTAKIDTLIEKKKKLIELLKEERTAVINHYVLGQNLIDNGQWTIDNSQLSIMNYQLPKHWEMKKLKYVAKVQSSNVDKKTIEGETPIFLCNYTDVYKNEYIDASFNFMKATATEKEIEKFILHEGDVLITKDSEIPDDIANPAYVKQNFENVICGYHLAQIKPNQPQLLGAFLFRLFQSKKFNSHFEVSANGVTRFGLPLDSITDVEVSFPSIEKQYKIVQHIEAETKRIGGTISKIEKEIELLAEYRKALISEVVTGKIKVI
jgi:type I restriction enzyme S subunit